MVTPYLAGTVLKTRSAHNRDPILQRHKLYDGVHADDDLIEEWASKIQTAIEQNRSKPDYEMIPLRLQTASQLALMLEDIHI